MDENKPSLNTPSEIAIVAEQFYAQKKGNLEQDSPGYFVAVDVTTGELYVAEFSDEALKKARGKSEYGIFHLIRIGASETFQAKQVSGHEAYRWSL